MAERRRKSAEQEPIVEVVAEQLPVPAPANNIPRYGRMVPCEDAPLSQCPTNLDLSTQRGKALMIAAGNPSDIEFDGNGYAYIMATNYAVFPDSSVDSDTGEFRTFARVVLFDASGRTYRTTSAHAPHRLAAICDLYSPAEWLAGIPIIISERRSRKTGRTYHDFRVDVSQLADAKIAE